MECVLDLPIGATRGGVCGIVATAIICKLSFDQTMNLYRDRFPTIYGHGRWGGAIYSEQMVDTIRRYTSIISSVYYQDRKYHHLVGLRLDRCCRMLQLMDAKTPFVIVTRTHIQIYGAGVIIDQQGPYTIDSYWARRRRVKQIFVIPDLIAVAPQQVCNIDGSTKPARRSNGKIVEVTKFISECKENRLSRKEILEKVSLRFNISPATANVYYYKKEAHHV